MPNRSHGLPHLDGVVIVTRCAIRSFNVSGKIAPALAPGALIGKIDIAAGVASGSSALRTFVHVTLSRIDADSLGSGGRAAGRILREPDADQLVPRPGDRRV